MKRVGASVKVNAEMINDSHLKSELRKDLIESIINIALDENILQAEELDCYDRGFKELQIRAVVSEESEIDEILSIISEVIEIAESKKESLMSGLLQVARNIILR